MIATDDGKFLLILLFIGFKVESDVEINTIDCFAGLVTFLTVPFPLCDFF